MEACLVLRSGQEGAGIKGICTCSATDPLSPLGEFYQTHVLEFLCVCVSVCTACMYLHGKRWWHTHGEARGEHHMSSSVALCLTSLR